MRVTVRDKDALGNERMVTGDYMGGAYIELTIGHGFFRANEMINVWDHETGKATIQVRYPDIEDTIKNWITAQDEEWPTWYEDYIGNERAAWVPQRRDGRMF